MAKKTVRKKARKKAGWVFQGTYKPYPGFGGELDRLVRHANPGLQVRLEFKHLASDHGLTNLMDSKGKRYFLITLNPGFDEHSTRDTLIHEWAHALSWHYGGPKEDDHGAHFGVAYARCYRILTYHDKFRG